MERMGGKTQASGRVIKSWLPDVDAWPFSHLIAGMVKDKLLRVVFEPVEGSGAKSMIREYMLGQAAAEWADVQREIDEEAEAILAKLGESWRVVPAPMVERVRSLGLSRGYEFAVVGRKKG